MSFSTPAILVTALLVFAASFAGVAAFRRYALSRGHLDIPNERSSHERPTPRGGGLVIAIVVLLAYLIASLLLGFAISPGYLVGSMLIVAVSWLDDVKSIAFHWRLLVHLIAASALLADCGYFDSVYLPFAGAVVYLGVFGAIASAIGIVWLINLYNFMDGIDGIAGAQAVTAGLGWLVIGAVNNSEVIGLLSIALTCASLGFLIHNWPPAKIFMGDAGSAFLGFSFAAMPFLAKKENVAAVDSLVWLAAFLLWMFVFDSAVTVVRRMIRGERFWHAHRSHLYQRLVINGYSHQSVTILYLVLSAFVASATCYAAMGYGSIELTAIPAVVVATATLFIVFIISRKRAGQ